LRHLDKSAWVWLLAIVVLASLDANPLPRLLLVSFQQPSHRPRFDGVCSW